jgi:hypothetical protein
MTARIVLSCDGTPTDRATIPLSRCRAALPTPALSPAEARYGHGYPAGWTRTGDSRDLCPGCSRAATEAPS